MRKTAVFDLPHRPWDWEHFRDLIFEMVRAELKARHFQRLLGPFWWLLEPALYAFAYFFLTTVLFDFTSGKDHLLFIFSSVIAWRWFSKSIDNAPNLIHAYQSFFKQATLPSKIILVSSAITEFCFFAFALLVLFFVMLVSGIKPTPATLLLPLVIAVQFALTFGLSSLLATAGVFLRDLGNIVYIFTGIWFYLSPGIYPIERVPANLMHIYLMNPWATILPAYRAVLLEGRLPNIPSLLGWLVVSLLLCIVGIKFFDRMRTRFYRWL